MRYAIAVLGILLQICSANAQGLLLHAGSTRNTAVTNCSQATTFLARTSGLNAAHQNAYTTLICGLVSAGVWTKLDILYIFATADRTTATLNLVSTSFTAVPNPNNTSSPAWAIDTGYTGVDLSTTVYISTQDNAFSSGGLYTLNSAHIMVWNNSNITSANIAAGQFDGVGGQTRLYPKFTADSKSYFRINDPAAGVSAGVTGPADSRGMYLANRSGSAAQQGYFDGVDQGVVSVTTSGNLSNGATLTLAEGSGGGSTLGSAYQQMAFSMGGSLTSTQAANFYSLLHAYLVTIAGIAY